MNRYGCNLIHWKTLLALCPTTCYTGEEYTDDNIKISVDMRYFKSYKVGVIALRTYMGQLTGNSPNYLQILPDINSSRDVSRILIADHFVIRLLAIEKSTIL